MRRDQLVQQDGKSCGLLSSMTIVLVNHNYINHMMYVISITACPVEGQVRKECASHPDCHQTCNTTEPVVCPTVCIDNGCECPFGTVIDEDKNECVPPKQCEGI